MELVTNAKNTTRETTGEKPAVKPKRYYDYTLLIFILMLVSFGLVMVTSASVYAAVKLGHESSFFLKRQAFFAIIGIIAMLAISKLDYKWYKEKFKLLINRNLIFWGYFGCIGLQVLVMVMGKSTNGSTRWLELPVIGKFQPSEISKIIIILVVAAIVSARVRRLDNMLGFLVVMIPVVGLAGLVVGENLSTAIVMIGIAFIMCFVASRKWLYFILSFLAFSGAAVFAIFNVGYRADRIDQWLHVETEGYQILQGLYAICSGGWFGKGLGNSVQKMGYIPEVQTDMIFTVICEELGIFGVAILLLVYVILLWRIFKIIVNARDLFGSLICTGVFAHLALQIIMNIAVVTNTIPSTGVVLPFISYGGTSLIILLAEMGIVLSVSNRIEYQE